MVYLERVNLGSSETSKSCVVSLHLFFQRREHEQRRDLARSIDRTKTKQITNGKLSFTSLSLLRTMNHAQKKNIFGSHTSVK